MYINNNMCPYDIRAAENKYNRIFRPWDNASDKQDFSQDCTVSTTTVELQQNKSSVNNSEKLTKNCSDKGFRPIHKSTLPGTKLGDCNQAQFRVQCPTDMYPSMCPEIIQANIAHSLGLSPGDPLFMETVVQGFALEEYARVLNQEHQAKILAAKKQRPKKYKCPHCDVGFSNNGQLKGHIRIHTGERPFKCDEKECGKTFTRNEELTRHKRIHSGLRPFPCSHCGKRFGRKDHLKKHSRTHFQPRGLYAVPVMLPFDTWASSSNCYPFVPMYGY